MWPEASKKVLIFSLLVFLVDQIIKVMLYKLRGKFVMSTTHFQCLLFVLWAPLGRSFLSNFWRVSDTWQYQFSYAYVAYKGLSIYNFLALISHWTFLFAFGQKSSKYLIYLSLHSNTSSKHLSKDQKDLKIYKSTFED